MYCNPLFILISCFTHSCYTYQPPRRLLWSVKQFVRIMRFYEGKPFWANCSFRYDPSSIQNAFIFLVLRVTHIQLHRRRMIPSSWKLRTKILGCEMKFVPSTSCCVSSAFVQYMTSLISFKHQNERISIWKPFYAKVHIGAYRFLPNTETNASPVPSLIL
jgi:hypothetical protein